MAAILNIILVITITMALSITLTMKRIGEADQNTSSTLSKELATNDEQTKLILPSKRLSRFLADKKPNPKAADHCHKNPAICGANSTCCNNKCMDLQTDNNNCGACKNKCKHTQTCCRGECVYLDYDKRHCGKCNNRCMLGGYCVYGMCDYA